MEKKDTRKSGSPNPMDTKSMDKKPDREFEGQGQNPSSGKGHGKQAGGSSKKIEDDNMTSGGREGKFSDTGSKDQGPWSPGSGHESDR